MGKVNTKQHIGNLLLSRGVISEKELSLAVQILEEEPAGSNRRLGQILHQDLSLDRHAIMREVASIYAFDEIFYGVDTLPEDKIETIKSYIEQVPKETLDELVHQKAIPVAVSSTSLTIATPDPSNPELSTIISKLNYKEFDIRYCRYELIDDILSKVYEQKNEFLDLLEDIDMEDGDVSDVEEEVDEDEIDAEINQSMLNSLVEGMLVEGVRRGVSDMHIIPSGPTTTDIRFRTDGKLQLWYQQKNVKPEAITAVIKDKTRNVDRFERDSSQDGFIQRAVDNYNIRYRVSIMPMVGAQFDRKFESIVIRILDDREVITDLNVLGLQEQAKKDFVKAIEKPSGIVIITGPTGSGKSTTLVAALYYVIDPTKNVLTIEEPVEYLIKGARQLKIGKNMTFEQAIRGILRHDPDIVLVGRCGIFKPQRLLLKWPTPVTLRSQHFTPMMPPARYLVSIKWGLSRFLLLTRLIL